MITSQEEFYTGGVTSIFIYLFVRGLLVVAKTFPFAIGMSIRRIDYFIGTAAMGVIVSIVFGSLIFLYRLLENQTNGWGTTLHFFHFPYVNDGTALEQFSMYMIIFAHLFFLGFLIMSFAQRFGGKGMIISAVGLHHNRWYRSLLFSPFRCLGYHLQLVRRENRRSDCLIGLSLSC